MPYFELDPSIASSNRSQLDKADRTRALNDEFRRNPRAGGIVLAPAVQILPLAQRQDLIAAIARFNGFSHEDDPYEEHDFASIRFLGRRYLWKIDYYDLDLKRRSLDPSDPAFTVRVMTIMLAVDY